MSDLNGGEEHLAPVIPLFGGRPSGKQATEHTDVPRRTGPDGLWRSALADGPMRFGPVADPDATPTSVPASADVEETRRQAEEVLVRKLRAKQLSVSEARTVLRSQDIDRDTIEQIIDEFLHRGYLDDRTLASLLVTAGVERKGQGRVALSRSLAQRGIPRDVVDEALAELPDDDEERALEYARSKARSLSRLDPDAALRRLVGQLARRGYGGSSAMNAARTALREAGSGRPSGRSGVHFVESD
ncbi:regulatory protein RecX [Microbacterium sp. MAHUQ-60]|uniref:regulatory protein RecX n=1 Tax=unclassified Microbacterium TaxID=2609290 RepID=UPI00360E406A